MAVLDVRAYPYDRPLSTVFGAPGKILTHLLEEDADPLLPELRILTYRYVSFFFHPIKDKFVICNGWKDPTWTNVRSLRAGISGDEKDQRERIFGSNLIDIEQKSIPQLLVDEVRLSVLSTIISKAHVDPGFPSLLRLPNRKLNLVVTG